MRRTGTSLGWKATEYLFVAIFVVILPIWFPILVAYVILDPPYYFARFSAKMKRKRLKN